jgi:hypothetical protein
VKIKKDIFILTLAVFLVTFLVWLPFFFGFGGGVTTIFKNFDGPNYLVIAKSWYDKSFIASHFSLPTPLEYYPAHFPAYPLTIAFLNLVLPGPWAMLAAALLATWLAAVAFYLLLFKFKLSENPLWLSLVFLVLPARWVVVKAVGSPEPLFLFGLLASFYFFKSAFDKVENNLFSKKKIVWLDLLLAGIFGALAQATKSPGILLFVTYAVFLLFNQIKHPLKKGFFLNFYRQFFKPVLPLLFIPLIALATFAFYRARTGDFFAYFHSGDNLHLFFPPYQGFFADRSWLGDFWREDLVWQYLLGALAVVFLFKRKLYDLASFAGVFFGATLFVAHRDLARYSLPLVPFALIAFDELLQRKEFKIALLIILPAVYLYAIYFIAGNTAPVADWTPYL